MSSGKFALTYTVKNEARLLPSAIEYHVAAGCSRIYLFWDGTTDGSQELVSQYPCVVARDSIRVEETGDAPEWIKNILVCWDTDMDVRKRINTWYAAKSAAAEGLEWLGGIDPDELVLMSRDEEIDADHIAKHLAKVPETIDQVLLPNLESVPVSAASENPFADCVYFLNRFPKTEAIWRYSRALLLRVTRSSALVAWYDYLFYQVRFLGALPRLMREPRSGSRIPAGYFLGYSNHKSFIRLKTFENFDFVTHRWRAFLRAPRSMDLGNILHFDMLDANYFAAKFRQRQRGIILKVFYLRYRLAHVARNLSDDEIAEFFERYIAISDPARIARLKRRGILVEIHAASNFMLRKREERSYANR
ncbi:glycosyltransferase family 2 protein [Telmatobacter sp. DSM 110680]|uniref:Glycosyltransferase family 2 protein n=1 Tax=Telmatobacter sp. DSM 110680 TaxID=3036704 RepID=A0AAU7DLW2_9BACT